MKSNVAYPIESFLAEVGGYLGLLLGVSLMDLSNIFRKSCDFINVRKSATIN